MTDPIRFSDAIAALLPALRPAVGPGAGHRPVSRAVICCGSGDAGRPPTAAAIPGRSLRPGATCPGKAGAPVQLGGALLPVTGTSTRRRPG